MASEQVLRWQQSQIEATEAIRSFLGIVLSSRRIGEKVLLQCGCSFEGKWQLKVVGGKVRLASTRRSSINGVPAPDLTGLKAGKQDPFLQLNDQQMMAIGF